MAGDQARATQSWAIEYDLHEPLKLAPVTPDKEALPPFEKTPVRRGERYRFAVDVIAEPTASQGKRGFLFGSTPNRSNFELFCDEGKAVGGQDLAPAPLAYLTSAVAFCMLSHIAGYLELVPLRVDRIKIEIRGDFWTLLPTPGEPDNVGGGCDAVHCYVIVDGDEDPAAIEHFIEVCRKSCIAMQTIVNAVPATTHIVLNGAAI